MNKEYKFKYEIENGSVSGYFSVYQGKDGFIYIAMGEAFTKLSYNQVYELNIDCYDLIDFNQELFTKAYEVGKLRLC